MKTVNLNLRKHLSRIMESGILGEIGILWEIWKYRLLEQPSWKIPETLEEVERLMNDADERVNRLMNIMERAWDPYGFLRRDIKPVLYNWLVYRKLLMDAYRELKGREHTA